MVEPAAPLAGFGLGVASPPHPRRGRVEELAVVGEHEAIESCAEERRSNLAADTSRWVRCNGSWWPGRILGMDGLPEDCFIPPRHTSAPIKLLGRPDGNIDGYNLDKSKRVRPFQCGEIDGCIENAKVQAHLQNISQNEGKYAHTEYAIMPALETEKSHCPPEGHLNTYGSCESINNQVSEIINQTAECSKEGIFSIRDHRRTKMKIISFVTPISKGNPKSDENLLPLEYEGTMECHAPDSDAFELEARAEAAVCEHTDLENSIEVHDVEVTALGNYTGHGLPLAFLTSKSTSNPIKGYPISVEVLEDYSSAASIDDHLPASRSLECLLKSRVSLPQKKRSSRSKPGGCKKFNMHKSSCPHAKKPAPDASPRKIQRLSSYLSDKRDQRLTQQGPLVGSMSPYYGRQLYQEEEEEKGEEDEDDVPPLHFAAVSPTGRASESSKRNPIVEKGSLHRTHSPPGANCKPVVAEGSLLPICPPLGAACSSTREYHLIPMTIFSGSCSPPLSLPPAGTSTGSHSGCTSLYLCSSSSLCAPVRLV